MLDRSLQRRALITSAAAWKTEAKDAQRLAAVPTQRREQRRKRELGFGALGVLMAPLWPPPFHLTEDSSILIIHPRRK